MSNAGPMTIWARIHTYTRGDGRPYTVRQIRQLVRIRHLQSLRSTGALKHGATGGRVHKPLPGRPPWTPTGSIATHVAFHCDPAECSVHDRPRMHRAPRAVA